MAGKTTVSIVNCSSYREGLEEHTSRLLEPLGGLHSFVKPGQSVLIKPNLLTDRPPEQAVTTHPELVRALIRMVRKAGASVAVGDSPTSTVKLERIWDRTGFAEMCREENTPLLNFEKEGSVLFSSDGCSFSIARPVLEADAVINVPKVKTHMFMMLTAGVKNMYGAIPGYQKINLHKLHPANSDFGRLMAAIYRKVIPALTVADAITAMHGDGPSAGEPINLGFLAASEDALALDIALCRELKINPAHVPYLRELTLDTGLEEYLAGTETLGRPESAALREFRLPSLFAAALIPRGLVKMLKPFLWIRPEAGEKCVSCGRCVAACPEKALEIKEKGGRPLLDPAKCIGCCCCHEVCPEKAVRMTQSPFLNLVRRGRLP